MKHKMNKLSLYTIGILLSFLPVNLNHGAINHEIESFNFFQMEHTSNLEISFKENKKIDLLNQYLKDDRQILLDFPNTKIRNKLLRGMDASEFSGSIVYISPYRRTDKQNEVRLAIQLRENVKYRVQQVGEKVIIEIENRHGAFETLAMEQRAKGGINSISSKVFVPKGHTVGDILENITYSGKKKYIGKKISFDVRNIPVESLLRMIANSSGFNIILGEDVQEVPPISLSIRNIPWDQALDTIMNLNKLVAKKNGNILMIKTLAKATEEEKEILQAKELSKRQEAMVTKVFPISFADTEDLIKILEEYKTPERGRISTDSRTNSVIVKDSFTVIERMKKIIATLDTQTPQILIEAKVVESSEGHAKNFGLANGLGVGYDPVGAIPDENIGPGFIFSTVSSGTFGDTGTGSTLLGTNIAIFRRLTNLSLELQMMESESKVKIISTPKVITQNKKEAKIVSTTTKNFKKVETTTTGRTETYEGIDATLDLAVTPQVTNDGSIVMAIKLTKEGFSPTTDPDRPPDKTSRSLDTNVLVDNGSTIVIGGIYSSDVTENHRGIPFLKDIPLLGWLFRTAYNPSENKNELIIFITPRIINQEEAGLSGNDLAIIEGDETTIKKSKEGSDPTATQVNAEG